MTLLSQNKKADIPFKLAYRHIISLNYYPIWLPGVTSLGGCINDSVPSLSSTDNNIPCDSTPFSLRGSRLATKHTCLPTRSSGLYHAAIPDMIVRLPIPSSIRNWSSLSAFGTFMHSNTLPTRRARFAKSSNAILAF